MSRKLQAEDGRTTCQEPKALDLLVVLTLNPDCFEGGKENIPMAKV